MIDILELRVNWHEKYANNPTVELVVEEMPDLSDTVMTQCGPIFVGKHESGFYRYFAHDGSDRNNGGYGGREFPVIVETEKGYLVNILRGPWSSRATVVNMHYPDTLVDIDVIDKDGHRRNMAISLYDLKNLCDEFDFPYYLVREHASDNPMFADEMGAIVPSVRSTKIEKPNGMIVNQRPVEYIY